MYPSPYSPPPDPRQPGYFSAMPMDAQGSARRAATLLLMLGGLILLLGVFDTISTLRTPAQQLIDQQKAMMPSSAETPFSAETMKDVAVAFGFATVAVGAAFIVLAGMARRASVGGTITALVLTWILLVVLGLVLLSCVVAGLAQPAIFALICLPGVPFALLVLQARWLSSALRSARQLKAAQTQYAAQYWQYQQQPPATGGYGYTAPPPGTSPGYTPQPPYPSPPEDSPRRHGEHGEEKAN
jgi:hypothetical protein